MMCLLELSKVGLNLDFNIFLSLFLTFYFLTLLNVYATVIIKCGSDMLLMFYGMFFVHWFHSKTNTYRGTTVSV